MKKITLLTILFFACIVSQAQVIEKQKRIVGGSLGFDLSQQTADNAASNDPLSKGSNFNINLSPSYGKAVKNNLVFGYQLYLNYAHSKNEDLILKDVLKSNGYGLAGGVFFEKFYPLTRSLSFSGYLPLSIGYSSNDTKRWNNSNLLSTVTNKNFNAGISLSPALNYALNKNFLIQLSLNDFISLGYVHGSRETKQPNVSAEEQSSSNFYFSSRINYAKALSNLAFGFSYIF